MCLFNIDFAAIRHRYAVGLNSHQEKNIQVEDSSDERDSATSIASTYNAMLSDSSSWAHRV